MKRRASPPLVSLRSRWSARMIEHGGKLVTVKRGPDGVYRFHHVCAFALLGLFAAHRIVCDVRLFGGLRRFFLEPIHGEALAEVVGFPLPRIEPGQALEIHIADENSDEIVLALFEVRTHGELGPDAFRFPWRNA